MFFSCDVKGCRSEEIAVMYYDHPVCEKHWLSHCNPQGHTKLKEEFRIKEDLSILPKSIKTLNEGGIL